MAFLDKKYLPIISLGVLAFISFTTHKSIFNAVMAAIEFEGIMDVGAFLL
jgi:hypothetical protein